MNAKAICFALTGIQHVNIDSLCTARFRFSVHREPLNRVPLETPAGIHQQPQDFIFFHSKVGTGGHLSEAVQQPPPEPLDRCFFLHLMPRIESRRLSDKRVPLIVRNGFEVFGRLDIKRARLNHGVKRRIVRLAGHKFRSEEFGKGHVLGNVQLLQVLLQTLKPTIVE
jgi:hypothetical protein